MESVEECELIIIALLMSKITCFLIDDSESNKGIVFTDGAKHR